LNGKTKVSVYLRICPKFLLHTAICHFTKAQDKTTVAQIVIGYASVLMARYPTARLNTEHYSKCLSWLIIELASPAKPYE